MKIPTCTFIPACTIILLEKNSHLYVYSHLYYYSALKSTFVKSENSTENLFSFCLCTILACYNFSVHHTDPWLVISFSKLRINNFYHSYIWKELVSKYIQYIQKNLKYLRLQRQFLMTVLLFILAAGTAKQIW